MISQPKLTITGGNLLGSPAAAGCNRRLIGMVPSEIVAGLLWNGSSTQDGLEFGRGTVELGLGFNFTEGMRINPELTATQPHLGV